MPRIADNALVNATRLIERIAEYRPEPQLGPEVEGFMQAVFGEVPPAAEVVERVARLSPVVAVVLDALLGTDLLADDDLRLAEAQRHPCALRESRSTADCCPASIPSTSNP